MLVKWPMIAACAALVLVGGGSAVYIAHERANQRELTRENEALTNSLLDLHRQIDTLSQRLTEQSEAKAQARPSHLRPSHPISPTRTKRPARAVAKAAAPRDDPRFKEIQGQLADQQKQIAGTREDLDKARGELSEKLDSARDDLSTSIAKNHDEVVELQKHGERNLVEFQIDKSKQFQRVGPIRISLRKADLKHKAFNVAMIVDDNEVQKKNVNLFEPVWINLGDETVELVVNQIAKDHVQGYLSEPKYKKSASAAEHE